METEGLARVSQRELWELVTYRQRPPDSFDSEAHYQWLADKFSRITNQLITKLQPVTAAAHQASAGNIPDQSGETSSYTDGELVDALDKLLTKSDRYYTAKAAAAELNKRNPKKTIGATKVGEHPIHKEHVTKFGRGRSPRNTSRQAKQKAMNLLIAQQEREISADEGRRINGRPIGSRD
jgi:hypothetical protein